MLKDNLLKTARIRNAEVCSANENVGYQAVFSEERDLKGWDVIQNGTLYGVSGGFYFLSVTASDVSLSRSINFGNVEAGLYTEVAIKYKYNKNREDSVADIGKVFFKTSSSPSFDDEKSVEFEVISDGEWHTYTVDMNEVTSWIGFITNLRIVFATNGKKGDEVFIESIKIQNPIFTFSDETSIETDTIVGDFFDNLLVGSSITNWSIGSAGIDRSASIAIDPSNSSNKVAILTNVSGTSSGPVATRILNDPISKGFFSCRVRVTKQEGKISLLRDVFTEEPIVELKFDSDGNIKYREGTSTYVNLQSETAFNTDEWISLLIEFSLDTSLINVVINGETVGSSMPYIFIGNVNGIRFENEGLSANSFYFDEVLLVETSEVGVCPGLGKRGQILGEEVSFSKKEIIENANDSIVVNINNFGPVVIKLPSNPGVTPEELRDLLEREISRLDIGGYSRAEVDFIGNRFLIRSGTYGFDSTVSVSTFESSTLAQELGFLNSSSEVGRPHSGTFRFSNTFKAKSYELQSIKNKDNEGFSILQDSTRFVVEIGALNAGTLSRRNKISGINKTFIDFNHTATDEGKITEIFFHGVLPTDPQVKVTGSNGQVNGSLFFTGVTDLRGLGVRDGDLLTIDTPGYDGNGTYIISLPIAGRGDVVVLDNNESLPLGLNLSFTISNIAKVKQFRINYDGTFNLINETDIGLEGTGLYTVDHDTYKINVDWYMHKGDYIGIYNAIELYAGNDDSDLLDAVYLEEEGDLLGDNIEVGTTQGNGINGIGLYGKNQFKQNKAIYDILFDEFKSIEYIDIKGSQTSSIRDYNLCSAIDNGLSLNVNIEGTHIHHVVRLSDATPFDFPQPNIPYNVFALTDGERFASNGFIGEFEQNVAGASYFYIDGDGEWIGIEEFPVGGIYEHKYIWDYQSDPFDITISWDIQKIVNRIVFYFKEYPNLDGFTLEWLRDSRSTFDGTFPGYERIGIGGSSEYTQVRTDGLIIDADFIQTTSAFYRHFQKIFDAYISQEKLDAGAAVVSLALNPYTVLDKRFEDVLTTSINLHCIHHSSTKIAEIELYSYTESVASLDSSVQLYYSIDDETFQRIDHDLLEDGSLRYRVGFPTDKIRLIIEPTNTLNLDLIDIKASDDYIRYSDAETEKSIRAVDVDIEKGLESVPTKVLVENKTCETASVEISVNTKELSDNVLLKTSLNTYDDIINPEIGPPGILIQDEDFDLPVIRNVAINAKTYGLSNLAANKPYYVATEFITESDLFTTIIDGFKWIQNFTNFPQTVPGPTSDIGLSFPGFAAAAIDAPFGRPISDIHAQLLSTWNVLGSFNAFVIATYDPRSAKTLAMGAEIGIIDNTGRYIVIRKLVALASAISGKRSWADYVIYDSAVGDIATEVGFCISFCGDQVGQTDYTIPYTLSATRIKDTDQDVLRFSYRDTVNGTGAYQWGDEDYYEVDLDALNLESPIKVVIGHVWNTTGLDPDGLPDEQTHTRITNFSFGGESTFAEHRRRVFDPSRTTGSRGEIGEDNRANLDLSPVKAVALDLGKKYYLDITENYTTSGNDLWNVLNSQFSNSNVSDVDLVEWGNSTPADARWVLFQEESETLTQTSGLKYLDIVRVYPDITLLPQGEISNSEWEDLETTLTDGNNRTAISQTDYPVVAVRLADQFDIANYRLLGSDGREFKTLASQAFTGWEEASQTQSDNITDNPRQVIWENWIDYESDTKRIQPLKWLAFRNKTFDITDGNNNKEYAGSVIVQTQGDRLDDVGQTNDRVDFTEYSEWFNANYRNANDIASLDEDQIGHEGTLFGGSTVTLDKDVGNPLGTISDAFDGLDTTFVGLSRSPAYLWRVFGELAAVSGDNTVSLSDSPIGDLIITGEPNLEIIVNYEETEVDGFFLELEESSAGVPNTISFQKFIGDDPESDASWETFHTETGLAQEVTTDFGGDSVETTLQFNGNEPFFVFLSESVVTSGIRMYMSDIQFKGSVDTSTTIKSFKVLQNEVGAASSAVILSNDSSIKEGGRRSLKVSILQGGEDAVKLTLGGALDLEPDSLWSIQDYLSFFMKIDDPALLDFSQSYIRIGLNSSIFYEWSLETIKSQINSDNLSEVSLKFVEAPEQAIGTVNFNFPTLPQRESQVDIEEGPIRFFQIELKPKEQLTTDLNIWFDNFYIKRERFDLQGNNKTLYLNNSELVYYPLTNISLERGFVEFVVTPDWTFDHGLTYAVEEAFTFFTLINEEDETFSCFYDENSGLTFTFSIGNFKVIFKGGVILSLEQYKPIKISVAWDSTGENINSVSNSNLRFWINDLLIGDFQQSWSPSPSKNTHFFLGSVAYKPDVSYNANEYYLNSDAMRLFPLSRSVHGGMEDLIISSEPRKVQFSDIITLKDKIFLSLDGVSYISGVDSSLPFTISSIAAGDSFPLWVKTNFPADTRNMSRTAFIRTKWRIS